MGPGVGEDQSLSLMGEQKLSDHEGEPVDKEEGANSFPRKTRRGKGAKHESQELRNALPFGVNISPRKTMRGGGAKHENTVL